MEISISRCKSKFFDSTQCSSCSCSTSSFPIGFSGQKLLRKKLRNPFLWIKCSLSERGLNPRPKPKQSQILIDESEREPLKKSQVRKLDSGICSQIEKLVFCRRYREALDLFEILELDGGFDLGISTFDALVDACISLKSIRGVKRVFNFLQNNGIESDQYMRNRVLLMHVKCGMMIDARNLFDEMPDRNLVSWNTLILGVVDSGNHIEAFRLFIRMWIELSDCNAHTFSTMIRSSAGLEVISLGKQLHSCALKMGFGEDTFVSCALIDMYSKCGSIEDAHFVFDEMPEKTTVGWNCIIAGYALHGYSEEALDMFYEMRDSGVKMDHFTFSTILRICTRLASVEHAKQAHAGLVRHGFGLDIVANTALVDFYSKWGRIEDARRVFDKMTCKNVISWNAIIAGYGNHGRGEEAIDVFEQMIQERISPNHVTFLAVLSACSHSELFEYGWEIFESMTSDYKIKPRAMHYMCMIEMLGREGLLDEAFALIRNAPFKPTTNMWAALLTACRIHGNLELGKFAAEKLYGMGPEKLSNYIVLLNIYNRSGKLNEAAGVVKTLKRKGLRMLPACSWIEVKKRPIAFLSREMPKDQNEEIYQKVDNLMEEISKLGYVSEKKFLLSDIDEKEEIKVYHSEKLAVAYGLMNTMAGTSLQIVQSHRICSDCHRAMKLIATVSSREIVIRDGSRFHHFREGRCSCGDYW